MKKYLFGIIILAAFAASPAGAVNMENSFTRIFISNLQPGAKYHLSKDLGVPLYVINKSQEEIQLDLRSLSPDDPRPEFTKIPNANWLQLSPAKSSIGAGKQITFDAVLSIPADESLRGKQFEVDILAQGTPLGGNFVNVGLALGSRVLFSISRTAVSPMEMKRKPRAGGLFSFSVKPGRVNLTCTMSKLGMAEQAAGSLVISNPGPGRRSLFADKLKVSKTYSSLDPGCEELPDLNYFILGQKQVKISPETVFQLDYKTALPYRKDWVGKKFQWIVQLTDSTSEVVGTKFIHFFLTIIDEKSAKAPVK